MIIINYNCTNSLEWTVFKGLSKDVEDFTRSKVMLFAISETNKIPLAIESKDDGCIKAIIPAGFEIPTGLTALTYDTELIWIKNGRDVNRTYQYNVFKVDTSSTALGQTIRIKSTALVYGYDGLSAYEIAMMKAEDPISENEWLRKLLSEKADKNGNSSEDFSANNIIVQHHVITDSIKNPIDLSSHGIMVPAAMTEAEYILTTSDGKNYGCSFSYSDKQIKLLGNNGQELSSIEAYNKEDADDIFEDLGDRISEKADANTVYTKSLIDDQMALKADVSYVDNTFATKLVLNQEAFERGQKDDQLDNRIDGVSTRVGTVERLIPTEADPDNNMLADKEFVNSSVSTNTATFRGSYNIVTALGLSADADNTEIAQALLVATSSCDNNDYCFAAIPVAKETPTTIKEVRRFKYSETNNGWVYEYTLNNSGFTAAQWAAINSNITSNLTAKLSSLPTSETLESALNSKANINDVYTINQADTTFIKQSEKIDYISEDVVDNSRVPTNLAVRLLGILLITALASKQNVINDLDTIRSNASGALQRSGGSMTGDLDLNSHALLVRNTGGNARYGIRFTGTGTREGVYVGNPNMRLFLEADPNLDLIHKKGNNFYDILDSGNTKTINGNSILGSGNIEINNVFKVEYGITNYNDIIDAIDAGMFVYAEHLAGVNYEDIYVLSTIIDNGVITFVHVSSSSTLSFSVSPDSTYTSITEYDILSELNSKQDAITSTNKLSADLVSDSTSEHRFVTASQKTLWNTVTEKAPLPFVVTCGIDPSDVSFVNSTLDEIWTAYQNGKNIRVKFAKAGGISFEDDAAILLDGSHNCVAHTVHNGTHYTITIYDDNGVTKLSYEETHDSDKQDVLVSGTNIKTINGNSILGSGNINTYETFVVTAGISPENIHTINKTISEINQANNDGKILRLHLGNAYDNISFEEDLTRVGVYENNEHKNIYVSHTVKSGVHYIVTIYEEDNTTKFSFETVLDSDKQDVIQDLSSIRSGAAAGATAYQKPQSGIPASDIANGVIPDVSQFITKSVNDLTNYYTKSDTYTQSEINTLLGNLNLFKYEIYTSTSEVTSPANNVLYLIGPSGTGNDQYEEYVYANNSFVKIGDTSIDLSGYITSQQLTTALLQLALSILGALDNKQDTISDLATIRSNASGAVQKNGDTMQGNLVLGISASSSNKLKFNDDRDFARFSSNAFIIGDPHIQLKLETGNVDLKHRYTENDSTSEYVILDTRNAASNLKTVNGQSVVGTGDIDTHDTFEVQYDSTAFLDIVAAYTAGKMLYANELGIKYQLGSVVINSQTQLPVMFTFSTLFVDNLDVYSFDVTEESNVTTYSQIAAAECYSKPNSGIPSTDFDSTVLTSLGKADTAYQLPTNGIPATDLESTVLTSLGKADTAVQPATLNSYLLKSGGQMSGDLDMNSHGLLVRAERNGIKFTGSGSNEGVYVGNGNMRLFLEADSTLDVKHKKGNNYYAMLDEGNTKTINSSSLYGSGDLLLYTVSDVKANLEAMFTALVSAGVIQNYTLTDPASGSKTFGFSFT